MLFKAGQVNSFSIRNEEKGRWLPQVTYKNILPEQCKSNPPGCFYEYSNSPFTFSNTSMTEPAIVPVLPSPVPAMVLVSRVKRERDCIDRKKNYLIFKRAFDILFSILFIAGVLSWLLPLLCILIKIRMGGPVFFLQKRVGLGGKTFTCFKLRTMVLNNEADILQAWNNDHRITGIGRFLRRTNLDELPQFFNILIGDMSLIGPRPHMHADCNRFASIIPGYRARNMVRPGLTGLAQIKGYHGPTITRDDVCMRFYWDKQYIHQAGLWVDLKIVFTTFFQCLIALPCNVIGFTAGSKETGTGYHLNKI
jgi:putative colanic acid biosynthesis UDP-glucose lipid carrier transferase